MSQANVKVARDVFDAWKAGDMETVRDLYDPDVIVRPMPDWPEPGPWVGREAVMRQFEQMRDAWSADVVEPISDFIDAADRVVVRFIWRGEGRGPEADLELTGIWTVRDGRIFYVEFFWDHAKALEAVGLSEWAMSQENVEIVRKFIEDYRRGDYDEALASLAPDVVYKVAQEAPVHGPEAVRAVWERWETDWEELRTVPEDFIDAGDHVVVTIRYSGRGRHSGIEIADTFFQVWSFRDGKCVRKIEVTDRAEALEAAGLSE